MKNLQEKKLHGQPDFPFAVYPGRLPEFGTGYPLHWHEELELIHVQSGTGIVTVRAERFQVRSGDMILIPPQTVHSIEQLEGQGMRYVNVLFRLSMLESEERIARYTAVLWSQRRDIPVFLPKDGELNGALTPAVLALAENRRNVHTRYVAMIYSHLYAILYHILLHCPESGTEDIRDNGNYEKMHSVLEYLKEHYAAEITVRQAADMCGFSESHFIRLFREQTGTSFAQYVKHQRLNQAAELLRTTGKRIGEVAEEVGFRNLSYFTRAFEEKYHMAPSAYREMWQKK